MADPASRNTFKLSLQQVGRSNLRETAHLAAAPVLAGTSADTLSYTIYPKDAACQSSNFNSPWPAIDTLANGLLHTLSKMHKANR